MVKWKKRRSNGVFQKHILLRFVPMIIFYFYCCNCRFSRLCAEILLTIMSSRTVIMERSMWSEWWLSTEQWIRISTFRNLLPIRKKLPINLRPMIHLKSDGPVKIFLKRLFFTFLHFLNPLLGWGGSHRSFPDIRNSRRWDGRWRNDRVRLRWCLRMRFRPWWALRFLSLISVKPKMPWTVQYSILIQASSIQ